VRLRKPDDAEDWTDAEANLLETLVDQLSLALEGARLYEESQRHAAQERLVGEISARMRTTLDLDTVLQTAAQEMREALGLPEVVVRLAPHPAGVAPQGEDIRGQTE
jgi:two-component system NtrC family sensor kinase